MLKLLRSLALGAPTVTDRESLISIGGTDAVAWVASSDEEFAAGIVSALKCPGDGSGKGRAAREFVINNFAWPGVVEQFVSLYAHMMRSGSEAIR